jgi:hypothetical protein
MRLIRIASSSGALRSASTAAVQRAERTHVEIATPRSACLPPGETGIQRRRPRGAVRRGARWNRDKSTSDHWLTILSQRRLRHSLVPGWKAIPGGHERVRDPSREPWLRTTHAMCRRRGMFRAPAAVSDHRPNGRLSSALIRTGCHVPVLIVAAVAHLLPLVRATLAGALAGRESVHRSGIAKVDSRSRRGVARDACETRNAGPHVLRVTR